LTVGKLKKINLKNIFAYVPHELQEEFDRLQLRNTLIRLKILAIAWIIIKPFDYLAVLVFGFERTSQIIGAKEIFFVDILDIIVNVLFILFASYLSKKFKPSVLWFICYLFIIIEFLLTACLMPFVDTTRIIQLFFLRFSMCTLVPDINIKMSVLFAILFYLVTVFILMYDGISFSQLGSGQYIIIDNFFVVITIKVLLYNRMVRNFVSTFEITQLNKKLEALSITDKLTNVNNRRALEDYMDILWKQCCRLQLPVTVLMIDVDFFKKYNDSLGHLEGDKALIAIAQCMKNQVKRETDFVARFGGEEFVCLLPYIEKTDAENFARELVQTVEGMKIPHPKNEASPYVTISAGMASVVPNENCEPARLMDEADKALYKAKQSGRNRFMVLD
jgi:diguanylate cyclase (GGDEF)-like protein